MKRGEIEGPFLFKLHKSMSDCPFRGGFVPVDSAAEGEGDPAREQHRGGGFVPGAVFVVANQRVAAAGKLHPDLMASSGVESNMDQAGGSGG